MIIDAAALLAHNPTPDKEEIRQALAGNLCRCGAHPRIIRAVQRAADSLSRPDS
jgi:nicotinate dehydrogenase subunit A